MRYPKFYQQQIAVAVRAFKTKDTRLLQQQLKFFRSWGAELELVVPFAEAMLSALGAQTYSSNLKSKIPSSGRPKTKPR